MSIDGEEGPVAQFKECILVAVAHPLELRFRTSTKELKTGSRVCKQAHLRPPHTPPILTAMLRCVPFPEVVSHWLAEI